MAYTAHTSDVLLKFLFTATAAPRPVSWTAHLYDGDPESGGLELVDSAYTAQAITFTVGDADANGRSEAVSAAPVAFPAIADGPVVAEYVVIKDELSNNLARIELLPPRPLEVGNILSFPAGGLYLKGE